MQDHMVRDRWNSEYEQGRYTDDTPIEFISKIKEIILKTTTKNNKGIYVGCGNGRNYIQLLKSGLDIDGVDISDYAVSVLNEKINRLNLAGNITCGNFLKYYPKHQYDYLVAIQVFQHGIFDTVRKYIQQSYKILHPNSHMFLRINSASTDIVYKHSKSDVGKMGVSIRYNEGPKKGLHICFLTIDGIYQITKDLFRIIEINEVTTKRPNLGNGSWCQFEVVMKRKQ